MNAPVEIVRNGESGITVTWNDGTVQSISSSVLRINCPSAVSRAKRGDSSHDEPIQLQTSRKSLLKIVDNSSDEELRLVRIWTIGNYAIGMQWGDGHDTGIYDFRLLRTLGNTAS